MSELRERILQRFQARTANIPVGTTLENGTVRIHRYRDVIFIWDLTNAGKRGKRVERLSVEPSFYLREQRLPTLDAISEKIERCTNFNQAKIIVITYLKENPNSLDIDTYQEKGVDVYPAGFKEIKIHTPHVLVEVGYKDFTVKNLDDKFNEPTCIPAVSGGLGGIPVFYRWVQEHESAIRNMDYYTILEQMSALGIPHHTFCAVD